MQKCKNSAPNADTTNDSLCNSSTSASKNNDNNKNTSRAETVTSTETNWVTTNDEGNNGEVAEAEAEAATDSAKLKNSNNSIDIGNSKRNYVGTKTLKRLDENENKMIGNNIGYDGENPSKTRESQQQKCGNEMSIARS